MKIILISVIAVIIVLFTKMNLSPKDENHYTIIKKINNIEIRKYNKLLYVTYTPKDSIDRNNSFRNVAGYIFGNNDKNEKINMTSPVVIRLHNNNEMAFIMPTSYTLNKLPKPSNNKLSIYEESSNTKACISYSGYSNTKKEKKYIQKLKKILNENNISHKGDFELLVYNSPYQFVNRKNEISVSINSNIEKKNNKMNTIYLGGGCFWCIEAVFENVIGVENVTSGYSGGNKTSPTYEEVSKGLTKHAEVCKIDYDKNKITLEDLLTIFFTSHDPTTLNRQGNDIGKHYRSIIFYDSEEEKENINKYIKKINSEIFNEKIVTQVVKFNHFHKAENYHQNYYQLNSTAPYCQAIITPKVIKLKKELEKYYK